MSDSRRETFDSPPKAFGVTLLEWEAKSKAQENSQTVHQAPNPVLSSHMKTNALFAGSNILMAAAIALGAATQSSSPKPANSSSQTHTSQPWVPLIPPQNVAPGSNEKTSVRNQSAGTLRVATNLVVLRVVVRDTQGKPVEGLQKTDFKLFDQGKEQTITRFEAQSSVELATSSALISTLERTETAMSLPAFPGKFLALYFDDLNTSEVELAYGREAADHYLSANLHPQDRVAIFTSGQMLSDFTSDLKQIRQALSQVHASARTAHQGRLNCPNLSDYQALLITQNPNNQSIDAWKLALDEANQCSASASPPPSTQSGSQGASGRGGSGAPGVSGGSGPGGNPGQQIATGQILQLAWNIVNQADLQARSNLHQIDQVVRYISQMPGQRTLILVSPGFLSASERPQLDRITDYALRLQVVISSLDPKGLVSSPRLSDASERYMPSGDILASANTVDTGRELYASNVLAEIADGTGGEYYHDNNNLEAEFAALGGSPAYYLLAFSPTDIEPNGKFHHLRVTLSPEHKGYTIQTRLGYFAPANEKEAEAEAKEREVADTENQLQEQVREAILSDTEIGQFPVRLDVRVTRGQGNTRDLLLSSHLDASSLPFRKDAEHNLNTVMFYFAVFDSNRNLLYGQARQVKVDAVEAQMPGLLDAGINAGVIFQLKPGNYRIREVVTELEERHMAAQSRNVEIAAHEKEETAALFPWDPPEVDAPVPSLSSTPACSLPDVLKLAGQRAEELVSNLQDFDAREQVSLEQSDALGARSMAIEASFDYQVDFTKQSASLGVQEFRSPLASTDARLVGLVGDTGVPALALIFHPELQTDYEMRCEGMGQWNHQPAWVVHFRQISGKRPRTAAIPTPTKAYPVSLKGRAWIAVDSGQVMHLETNLVKGISFLEAQSADPVFVRSNSVSVDYAPVKFQSKNVELWLPASVLTFTDYGSHRMTVKHIFSDFRLFSVQTQQVIEKPKDR
jgi:VWFA-related protein